MSWKFDTKGLAMMNWGRVHSSVMRPRIISIQILKAGNIWRVRKQYANEIRSSEMRSYSWGTIKKKQISTFRHSFLITQVQLMQLKHLFERIYMVYQYIKFMNILTNKLFHMLLFISWKGTGQKMMIKFFFTLCTMISYQYKRKKCWSFMGCVSCS